MLVYNFGSAVLRSYGDSRRPMYYLLISGTVNVILNPVSYTHLDVYKRQILRSRRTLSMMRSLSILLNASSNTTKRTVLPKLDVSLTRYS